jgi:hypothetical protein
LEHFGWCFTTKNKNAILLFKNFQTLKAYLIP